MRSLYGKGIATPTASWQPDSRNGYVASLSCYSGPSPDIQEHVDEGTYWSIWSRSSWTRRAWPRPIWRFSMAERFSSGSFVNGVS